MKRICILNLCFLLITALGGCANTSDNSSAVPSSVISNQGNAEQCNNEIIVMFDATDLPATFDYRDNLVGIDYEVVVKDVIFREMSALEKEKSYNKDDYIAIVQYSAKIITPNMTKNLYLSEQFALVIGDSTDNRTNNMIQLDTNEYYTEDFDDGYYQGYAILVTSKEYAESEYTQLRYIAPGNNAADYFNIR